MKPAAEGRAVAAGRRVLASTADVVLRPARILATVRRADVMPDLVAGLTVAVLLLPQAVAYASIAELPAQMGLYAAIVAAIAGALWGSSAHLHTGPTNASSLLVLATLLTVAQPGTPEFITAAGFLAVLAGGIRLLMGLLRMGVLVNFVSDSVVTGFMGGAGVLIFANQMRHLLRLDMHSSPELVRTVQDIAAHLGSMHLLSLAMGVGTMVVLGLIRALRPRWPAALIAMVAASAATAGLRLEEHGLVVLGTLPRSLPPVSLLPLASGDLLFQMAAGALAIAAIGLVEATSSARAVATRSGQRLDTNQEFVGQGAANILAGFLSGYPVSGSPTRTLLNYDAGARTPLAAVFSGLWVLAAMLVFAPLARYLPRAALAGVVLVTAWGMIDRKEMRRILRTSRGDSSIMIATMLGTLILPLETAVLGGMLVSFGRFLIKTSTPGVYPVVPDENFRHFLRAEGRVVCPQLGVMKIEGSLYFGAVNHIEEAIYANQEANPRQMFLLLKMHMVDHCDVSGIHMLEAVVRAYRRRGGDVFLDGVRPAVRHMMHLAGFDAVIGADNILDQEDTIGHLFHRKLHPGICIYECKERVFAECQALPKDSHAAALPDSTEIPEHEIDYLSPSTLRLLMADPDTDIVLVDVGEPGEYRNWHIAGAKSIPLRQLTARAAELDRETSVCFVSRLGRRAALATVIMQDFGHQRVFVLKGGMLAWEAAGYPIAVE
ncbi:MAG TPA: SulP family inorganic anion transporter [Candidatus Krumholzibacteria bacterium]|nr:SulP family inorganic anion transporter [Candidatus Krumholzibacteria bacterium]